MEVLGIHHVAFAHGAGSPVVAALESLLGLPCRHTEAAEGFVERMAPVGDGHVQLLEGVGDDGVVNRFLRRRGDALHHLALRVDDVAAAVDELLEAGVPMIDERPRPGGMGTTIAFVHPSAFGGLLVELVEE